METVVTSAPIKFGTQTRLFHEMLREERQRRRFQVATLAKWALVSEDEYKKWEMGSGLPTLDQMTKMFGNNQPLLNVLRAAHQAQSLLQKPDDHQRSANADPAASTLARVLGGDKKGEEGKAEEPTTPTPASSPAPSPSSPAPTPSPSTAPKEARLSFGAALRECRDNAGQSQNDVGAKLNVSAGMVAHWEHGRVLPSKAQYDVLCGLFPTLPSLHEPTNFVVVEPKPTKVEFATAFKKARVESGMSMDDIASRLNVGVSTVYAWTRGVSFPNADVYDRLVALFPTLSTLPRPANLIAPPSNALSRTAEVAETPAPKVELDASSEPAPVVTQSPVHSNSTPLPPPDILTTLDVAIAAFGELGVDLTPKFEREAAGLWRVEISDREYAGKPTFKVDATGNGMPEAAKNALLELAPALSNQETTIQARIADLQSKLATIQKASAMVAALGVDVEG